jgi:hypothetical protein
MSSAHQQAGRSTAGTAALIHWPPARRSVAALRCVSLAGMLIEATIAKNPESATPFSRWLSGKPTGSGSGGPGAEGSVQALHHAPCPVAII